MASSSTEKNTVYTQNDYELVILFAHSFYEFAFHLSPAIPTLEAEWLELLELVVTYCFEIDFI
jgi:hypothetical protein